MSEHPAAWPIYKRLLGYSGAYWPLLSAALVGMIVEALAGGAFVQLMDPLVNRGFVHPEPRMAVLLRPHAPTPHQAVVTALDAVGQLGFTHVSIATAPAQ